MQSLCALFPWDQGTLPFKYINVFTKWEAALSFSVQNFYCGFIM